MTARWPTSRRPPALAAARWRSARCRSPDRTGPLRKRRPVATDDAAADDTAASTAACAAPCAAPLGRRSCRRRRRSTAPSTCRSGEPRSLAGRPRMTTTSVTQSARIRSRRSDVRIFVRRRRDVHSLSPRVWPLSHVPSVSRNVFTAVSRTYSFAEI
eukprot:5524078-Prymnesium_polylepis.2